MARDLPLKYCFMDFYESNSADVCYAPQKYRYIFTPKQFLKFVVKHAFSQACNGGLAYGVALLPRVSSPKKNFVHPPKNRFEKKMKFKIYTNLLKGWLLVIWT